MQWVHFNVGGEYFCTTRSTLGQEQSSMLHSIVEDEGALSVSRDEKGRILFDRGHCLYVCACSSC